MVVGYHHFRKPPYILPTTLYKKHYLPMISGRFGLGLYATADVALRAIGTLGRSWSRETNRLGKVFCLYPIGSMELVCLPTFRWIFILDLLNLH